MDSINTILKRINNKENLDEVRNDIINLIKDALNGFGEDVDNWQKYYIGYAIKELSNNVAQKEQTSEAWLRTCLLSLEKSFTPSDERDDNLLPNIDELNKVTYEQLIEAINAIP